MIAEPLGDGVLFALPTRRAGPAEDKLSSNDEGGILNNAGIGIALVGGQDRNVAPCYAQRLALSGVLSERLAGVGMQAVLADAII